ncbi:MAG: hypothetical protein ACJ8DZ_11535 [Allosphingosinicella sp.]
MRRLLFLALLALAACGDRKPEQRRPGPAPEAAPAASAPGNEAAAVDDRIACATGGAGRLERVCTLDRGDSPRGQVLTLYSPDGSFRRLLIATDGHGVVAADGSEGASVKLIGPGEIEVTVGGDRYRLPAHAK